MILFVVSTAATSSVFQRFDLQHGHLFIKKIMDVSGYSYGSWKTRRKIKEAGFGAD